MVTRFVTSAFPLGIVLTAAIFCANPTYADEAMWAKLAEGGKVVLMRHGSLVKGRNGGSNRLRDPSCNGERNLSDEGKHEAKVIGERFKEHNVPIEQVLFSPYCRTADTAKIAFGTGSEADFLSLREVLGPDEASAQTARLNEVIGSYTGKGNLVLVTHEPNINAVSFEMVKTSDFIILQPKGGSSFEELGIVRWSEAN